MKLLFALPLIYAMPVSENSAPAATGPPMPSMHDANQPIDLYKKAAEMLDRLYGNKFTDADREMLKTNLELKRAFDATLQQDQNERWGRRFTRTFQSSGVQPGNPNNTIEDRANEMIDRLVIGKFTDADRELLKTDIELKRAFDIAYRYRLQ
jgi:hypothetical protein